MSQTLLLDASAVLAFLQGEPGGEQVQQALQDQSCVVGAANQAEVIAKSLDRGLAPEAIQAILAELAYAVIEVKAEDGAQAGYLRALTRHLGLSLVDRLCLTAAKRLNATVLTADRPWLTLRKPLGIDVVCIRPEQ